MQHVRTPEGEHKYFAGGAEGLGDLYQAFIHRPLSVPITTQTPTKNNDV
jgi:hypothetical protein